MRKTNKTICRVCSIKLTSKNCPVSFFTNKKYICSKCNAMEQRESRAKVKLEVFAAYGSSCICCSCAIPEFLTIDHIDGTGAEHRRQLKTASSDTLYRWLKKHNFPKDNFQVLCFNCNSAKYHSGVCPHQKDNK